MVNKPWRCERYTRWVKQQNCIVTQQPADDPHHIVGHGFSGSGKAPDWAVIPLTREIHRELHHIGYIGWELKYGDQMDLLGRFWRQNFDEIQEFLRAAP